jgi:hypothetical protein
VALPVLKFHDKTSEGSRDEENSLNNFTIYLSKEKIYSSVDNIVYFFTSSKEKEENY